MHYRADITKVYNVSSSQESTNTVRVEFGISLTWIWDAKVNARLVQRFQFYTHSMTKSDACELVKWKW